MSNLRTLIKSGVRAQNDGLDLEAQVAQLQQNVLEARNNFSMAKFQLSQLMLIDPNTLLIDKKLPESITLDPTTVAVDDVAEAIIRRHPAYKAAKLGIVQAQLGEKIASASYYPSLGVGGNLGTAYANSGVRIAGFSEQIITQEIIFNGIPSTIDIVQNVPILEDSPYFSQLRNNLSLGLGLNIQIPIFNNGNASLGVERAKLNTLSQNVNKSQIEQQLTASIQQIILDAQAAQSNYRALNIVLEAQQKAFANTEKRYNLGAVGNFEWINAQNALQQAELNQKIAEYQYYFTVTLLDIYLNDISALNK